MLLANNPVNLIFKILQTDVWKSKSSLEKSRVFFISVFRQESNSFRYQTLALTTTNVFELALSLAALLLNWFTPF